MKNVLCFLFLFFSLHASYHPLFETAHWGLYIVDADTDSDETIYSHNCDRLFVPASITKLFTTKAALEKLGDDHTFATRVAADCHIEEGQLPGNLYLIGGCDPDVKTKDLYELADKVHALGIKEILGKVFLLPGQEEGIHQHTEWEDIGLDYAQETHPLAINDNLIKVNVNRAELEQDVPYCTLISHVEAKDVVEPAVVVSKERLFHNVVELSGVIPKNDETYWLSIAIHKPQEYAKLIFIKALQAKGIAIQGNDYPEKECIDLAHIPSVPLSAIVHKINKISHNLGAWLLFEAIERDVGNSCIYDGAGLSRHNLLSPKQTVQLLKEAIKREAFYHSLPIGGVDGSLEKRFNDQNAVIRAKTGSMSGIANLAGIIEIEKKRFIFAFFINNSLYSAKETTAALDDFLKRFIIKSL